MSLKRGRRVTQDRGDHTKTVRTTKNRSRGVTDGIAEPRPLTRIKFGYSIAKSSLREGELAQLAKDLTITRPNPFTYSGKDEVVMKLFQETKSLVVVPRNYGVAHFGPPAVDETLNGDPLGADVKFVLSLRNGPKYRQKEAVDATLAALRRYRHTGCAQALVVKPCGSGKTYTAMAIVAALGYKAFVLVGSKLQMYQFYDSIVGNESEGRLACMPAAKVGLLGDGKCDTLDKDIVIGTVQSLMRYTRSEAREKLNVDAYGVLILDECHHVPTQTFYGVIRLFRAAYRVYLTATHIRDDGIPLDAITGPPTYDQPFVWTYVKLLTLRYWAEDTSIMRSFRAGKTTMNWAGMMGRAECDENRNNIIVELMTKLHATLSPVEQVIIVGSCVEHLDRLTQMANEAMPQPPDSDKPLADYVCDKTPEKQRKVVYTSRFILGTHGMFREAFDRKTVRVVIKVTPRKGLANCQQTDGRATRECSGKGPTVIFDIVDMLQTTILSSSYDKHRVNYYKKRDYDVEEVIVRNPSDLRDFVIPSSEKTQDEAHMSWAVVEMEDRKREGRGRAKDRKTVTSIGGRKLLHIDASEDPQDGTQVSFRAV